MSAHVANRAENGQAKVRLASLLWGHAAHHLCAILERLLHVKARLRRTLYELLAQYPDAGTDSLACETLAEDFGVLVDAEIGDGVLVRSAYQGLREEPATS